MKLLYIHTENAEPIKINFDQTPNVGSVFEFWCKEQNRAIAGEVLSSVEIEGTNCVSIRIKEVPASGFVKKPVSLFDSFAPATAMPKAQQNVRGRNITGDII